MLRLDRLKLGKKFTVLAAALFIFNSCASQDVTTEELPDLPTSEASLLDESEQSTPVGDDSAIFADLNPMDASASSDSKSSYKETKASSDATATDGDPFYNPIGGESLARVAYTLYGDRALAKALRAQNPSLADVKKLEMGQMVYFEFDKLKPTPTYLTKDLIDRYSDELAEKLGSNGELGKDQVVLEKGETLQSLSQRLYGTTRYWTEIYLLNKGNLKSYDRVAAGVSLVVFQRSPAGAPTTPNDNVMAGVERRAPEVKAPVVSPAPIAPVAPVAEESATPPPPAVETPADPIPETPPAAVSAPAPEPYVPQPLATQGGSSDSNNIATAAGNSNTRRIIYVALILLVGGLAFYFTRPKKKKFDMLDATAASSGRQKLGSEQKKDIV